MNDIKFKYFKILFIKMIKDIKLPEGHDDISSIKSIDDCLRKSACVCGKKK